MTGISAFTGLRTGAGALALAMGLFGMSPGLHSAELPDVAVFFAHPAVLMARISPAGDYVALVRQADRRRFEILVSPAADPTKGVIVASSDVADIVALRWVNDQRLVFRTSDLHGDHQVASLQGGLFAVDRDGSDSEFLITADWGFNQEQTGSLVKKRLLPANFTMLGTTSDGSDDIIVGEREFNALDRHLHHVSPYRLNTRTRTLTAMIDTTRLPAPAQEWMFDADDRPRLFIARDSGRRIVYYHAADGADWQMLGNFDEAAGEGFAPEFFGYDGTLYVTQSQGAEASALYRYDLVHRRTEDQPLVRIKGFDFAGSVEADPQARKVLGFHFDADAHGTAWIDARFKDIQARIDKALPATVNRISCGNCLSSKFLLVSASSDREPERYLLFDTTTERLVQIAASRPGVKPAQMGERNFYRYAARDGLSIPLYVTMPPGKATGPLPTIVLVHGGPWVRGASWEWSADAQFLASRGYAVLEPEFRGSTGYGFQLFKAGWRQWGLAMQDDLADAAKWAIAKGIADPKRIAIGGASYGGYATLMGLIKNPELFRCGFEWVGVTDIDLMYSVSWSDASDAWLTYGMPRLIGDREKDAEQLRATSPLANASRLSQPLLMAYGGLDRRVPIVHGTKFHDAVSANNHQVEWLDFPSEGHGWYIDADSIDFWTHVEKFLQAKLAAQP